MSPTVWQRAQVWALDNALAEVTAIGGGDLDQGLLKMYTSGFTALHVKVQDGQTEENVGVAPLLKARLKVIGLGGKLKVGGWGQLRGDGFADAEKTNGLLSREMLDYFVGAGEFEWKGDPGSANWNNAAAYFGRLKQIDPARDFLLFGRYGFCSMPNEPAGDSFDWATIRAANARWVPECYANNFPTEPSQWPDDAQTVADARFFRSYVHPALGMYDVEGVHPAAAAYISRMRHAKTAGFSWGYSIYPGYSLTDGDWAAFSAVNHPAGTPSALAWF